MNFPGKRLGAVLLCLFVSIAAGGEKEHETLQIGPASSFAHKQTSEGVTVAADVYETGDKVKAAFSKHSPYDYGILPILVVIDNHAKKAIRVDALRVEYNVPGGGSVEATPAQELRYLRGARTPRPNPSPLPIPGVPSGSKSKKSPLSDWEIEGRAFAAKVIPPGESASGFFYFQTGHRSGSSLYITGMREAGTDRELLYFEIPLNPVQ